MMPVSYERKLFKVGEGGVAVTLPKAWINYLRLKPGDTVEIIAEVDITIRIKNCENPSQNSNKAVDAQSATE